MKRVVAVDVGQAEIRMVGPGGAVCTLRFSFPEQAHELSAALSQLFGDAGPFDALAVTTAAEGSPAFDTKVVGLRHILASVKAAAVRQCPTRTGSGRKCGFPEILVWRTDRRFTTLGDALDDPVPCMSSGWLALAVVAARRVPQGRGVLVHVGPATTHLVAIADGDPRPIGATETERLVSGELVYSGVSHTPIAAVVREVPLRGARCPVSAEPSATTRDAYVVLGRLEECPSDMDTADGRPATRACAVARLARAVCADPSAFGEEEAREVAAHVLEEQVSRLRGALARLERACGDGGFSTAVVSGPGEFVARLALEGSPARVVPVSEALGSEAARAAVAYALWQLATEAVAK